MAGAVAASDAHITQTRYLEVHFRLRAVLMMPQIITADCFDNPAHSTIIVHTSSDTLYPSCHIGPHLRTEPLSSIHAPRHPVWFLVRVDLQRRVCHEAGLSLDQSRLVARGTVHTQALRFNVTLTAHCSMVAKHLAVFMVLLYCSFLLTEYSTTRADSVPLQLY